MSETGLIKRRSRVKHEKSFEERLADDAARFKEAADKARPGMERELLLRRARQLEEALHMSTYLRKTAVRLDPAS